MNAIILNRTNEISSIHAREYFGLDRYEGDRWFNLLKRYCSSFGLLGSVEVDAVFASVERIVCTSVGPCLVYDLREFERYSVLIKQDRIVAKAGFWGSLGEVTSVEFALEVCKSDFVQTLRNEVDREIDRHMFTLNNPDLIANEIEGLNPFFAR